jgi:hypothetical protein
MCVQVPEGKCRGSSCREAGQEAQGQPQGCKKLTFHKVSFFCMQGVPGCRVSVTGPVPRVNIFSSEIVVFMEAA